MALLGVGVGNLHTGGSYRGCTLLWLFIAGLCLVTRQGLMHETWVNVCVMSYAYIYWDNITILLMIAFLER